MPQPATAVIDLETTGFRRSDRIIEIGVVLLDRDLRTEGTWQTLVQPERDIDNSHVHGITASDLVRAPRFSGVAGELAELLAGRVIIAHNAPFDTRFLVHEFSRLGVELPPERSWALCTRRLSRELLPGSPQKLADCLDLLGLHNDRPHAALADAEATADLYRELVTRYNAPHGGVQGLPARQLNTTLVTALPTAATAVRAESPAAAGSWLERLSGHVPDTGIREVDDYRSRLRAAMLDGQLSASEIEDLITTAHTLGLSREEAGEIHGDYLRQLAVEAWADGVITPAERELLHDAAQQLGVPAREVEALFAQPLAGLESTVARVGLRPGDRVTFTGVLELGRDNWEARALAAGLSVGGVTRSSALLVSANPDSMSGKARKAREYGVPIIDEATFARLLHEVEEDRDIAADPGMELSAETATPELSWFSEVFPWLRGRPEEVTGVAEVAGIWLREHHREPLADISPRLEPQDFPEGVNPGGLLGSRWLNAHPEPLSASVRDLADLPGFGESSVGKILTAVLLSALDAPDAPDAPDAMDPFNQIYVDDAAPEPDTEDNQRSAEAVDVLAEWWWLLNGSLPLPAGPVPAPVAAALTQLASDPHWADPAARTIARAAAEIAGQVGTDIREQDIFRDRLLGDANLESLGQRHGVTRERIRQLEVKLKQRLTDTGSATELLLAALPTRFGPLNRRSEVLREIPALGTEGPAIGRSMLHTLDWFAVDWELTPRWFQSVGFEDELSTALEEHSDEHGVAQIATIAETLGVDETVLRERLSEEPENSLHLLDEQVLTQVRAYGDRAVAILSLAGEPLSLLEIIDRYGEGKIRALSNALSQDDRVVRIGRDRYALATWGGEAYTSLAEWIGRRVDEHGHALIRDLIEEATTKLGVAASSVRAYATTAEFETREGIVTRVAEIQDTWADPAESAGLYRNAEGWRLLLTLNHDHLRGSGFGVPKGVATIYRVPLLSKYALTSPLGEQIISNSRTGVAVGSIRRFLQESGSGEGDRVWLNFTTVGGFTVTPATPRRAGLSGVAELLNRMGLDTDKATAASEASDSEVSGRVNQALDLATGVPRRKTVSRFRHRNQDDLADLVSSLR